MNKIKAKETFDINYLDPSSMSAFTRCPAKYYFSRLLSIEKQDVGLKHLAMDYGTDFHEVLPHCYDKSTLDTAIDMFKDRWTARNHDYNDKRNIDCAERSLIEFCNNHSGSLNPYTIVEYPISAPTKSPVAKNEIPFLIDIGGSLPLAGRIDAAVRWNSDDSLWALDYKTSGEVSQRLFNNFENCPQAIGYTLALSHIADEQATGFILEVIRISKTNTESQMHLIFIKDCQMQSFIAQANETSSKILTCNEKKEWPMNLCACGTYPMFGQPGYTCDFLDICTNPDKEEMIKFYKKTDRYHPFEIDSERKQHEQ